MEKKILEINDKKVEGLKRKVKRKIPRQARKRKKDEN